MNGQDQQGPPPDPLLMGVVALINEARKKNILTVTLDDLIRVVDRAGLANVEVNLNAKMDALFGILDEIQSMQKEQKSVIDALTGADKQATRERPAG